MLEDIKFGAKKEDKLHIKISEIEANPNSSTALVPPLSASSSSDPDRIS